MEEAEAKSKYNARQVLLYPSGRIEKRSRKEIAQLKKTNKLPEGALVFDSGLEAEYYRDMILPNLGHAITDVQMQPKFVLLDGFRKYGRAHIAITYSPDFQITYANGVTACIDVKGVTDQKFPIKRKLFDHKFPDMALFVMKKVNKFGGWITDDVYKQEKSKERKAAQATGAQIRPRRKARASIAH